MESGSSLANYLNNLDIRRKELVDALWRLLVCFVHKSIIAILVRIPKGYGGIYCQESYGSSGLLAPALKSKNLYFCLMVRATKTNPKSDHENQIDLGKVAAVSVAISRCWRLMMKPRTERR